MRSCGEPLSTTVKVVTALMLKKLKLLQKSMFSATSGNLNKSNLLDITENPQQENFESFFFFFS